MKNILKLSLAVVAIAALSACGGGDSSDAADSYTGNWKSNCYKFTSTNGNSYYGQQLLTFSKASASELAGNYSKGVAYTDAGCTNVAGNLDTGPAFKVNSVMLRCDSGDKLSVLGVFLAVAGVFVA